MAIGLRPRSWKTTYAGRDGWSIGRSAAHEPLALSGDLDGDARPEKILYSAGRILVYRSKQTAKMPALHLGTGVNVTLY